MLAHFSPKPMTLFSAFNENIYFVVQDSWTHTAIGSGTLDRKKLKMACINEEKVLWPNSE